MASGDVTKCRSCQAPIQWVYVEPSGKAHPVNAEPLGTSLFDSGKQFHYDGGGLDPSKLMGLIAVPRAPRLDQLAFVVSQYTKVGKLAEHQLHVTHFATCPNAAGHRRDRRAAA